MKLLIVNKREKEEMNMLPQKRKKLDMSLKSDDLENNQGHKVKVPDLVIKKARKLLKKDAISVSLVGSMARGEVHEDSDIDLLVVMSEKEEDYYDGQMSTRIKRTAVHQGYIIDEIYVPVSALSFGNITPELEWAVNEALLIENKEKGIFGEIQEEIKEKFFTHERVSERTKIYEKRIEKWTENARISLEEGDEDTTILWLIMAMEEEVRNFVNLRGCNPQPSRLIPTLRETSQYTLQHFASILNLREMGDTIIKTFNEMINTAQKLCSRVDTNRFIGPEAIMTELIGNPLTPIHWKNRINHYERTDIMTAQYLALNYLLRPLNTPSRISFMKKLGKKISLRQAIGSATKCLSRLKDFRTAVQKVSNKI
ncbi:MAG: nucleotidyltransferase domain-containing protein [Candidatus Hodarchaeota archaeon]